MNICEPFIRRPIATTRSLSLGSRSQAVWLSGCFPVSPLPQVDFPTIFGGRQFAGRQSRDDGVLPWQRRSNASLDTLRAVTEMTLLQHLGPDQRHAAIRVGPQYRCRRARCPSLHQRGPRLSAHQPSGSNPTYRKVNPADSPIFMLALTSPALSKGQMYDAASTIMAQKLSQLERSGPSRRGRKLAASGARGS